MTLYYNVIKAFLDSPVYDKYHHVIDEKFLKENYPETFRVYQSVHALHRASAASGGPTTHTVDDLALRFYTEYPNASQNEFTRIFQSIRDADAQPDSVQGYLHNLLERQRASRIAELALAIADGNGSGDALQLLIGEAQADHSRQFDGPARRDYICTTDLAEIYESEFAHSGLRWRLDSLNKALGSLREGDFGFVFARPESGKTTLLASEVSFMAGQTDGEILWFNNEEKEKKVVARTYQATLGLDKAALYARIPQNNAKYNELTGDRIKVIKSGGWTYRQIEAALAESPKVALIIFDQIDKINGFGSDRNDLELEAIYTWAREIAKQYAPVIAVCQAGGSGENKRWLTMNDVNNSKTGKQGAADWILGIGKVQDDGLELVRYLHLSKNKLPGDQDSDPGMRHGQWEVKINPLIGRYEDWA